MGELAGGHPAPGRAADRLPPHPLPALLHSNRTWSATWRADLDAAASDLGQVPVTLCFIDLTGFTRYTEEEGDLEALDVVENFVETVEATLPPEATIVKTIGDEVMVVSPDAASLTEWAVGLLDRFPERPQPRVGIHYANAVYRDGDYFGTHVNLVHRVVDRAQAGEVLVTDRVTERARASARAWSASRSARSTSRAFPMPTPLFIVRSAPSSSRAVHSPRRAIVDQTVERRHARGRCAKADCCRGDARGRDALRRTRLGLPARPRRSAARGRRGHRAARQLRLRDDSDADEAHCAALCEQLGVAARDRAAAPPRGPRQPAGLGARHALRRGGAAGAAAALP